MTVILQIEEVLSYDTGVLSLGRHTIKIRLTGTKNAASTSTITSIDFAAVTSSTTSSPPPTASPAVITGDLNSDRQVNALDLSILLSHWGTTNTSADINHDGTVNVIDLSALLSHWSA